MALAAVAADVLQPLDILLGLASEGALDQVVGVDKGVDRRERVLVELGGAQIRADLRFGQNVGRELGADPVDVLEGEEDLLFVGHIDAGDTWHGLPLNLLVLRVRLADHPHLALATHNLAGAADPPDAGLDLHDSTPSRPAAGPWLNAVLTVTLALSSAVPNSNSIAAFPPPASTWHWLQFACSHDFARFVRSCVLS